MSELIPIYQRHLTSGDMKDVLVFYHSEAGQHILASQTVMMNEAQEHFRAIGARIGQEAAELHRDEILEAEKKYEQGIADKQTFSPK